jgi:hypothetical protein
MWYYDTSIRDCSSGKSAGREGKPMKRDAILAGISKHMADLGVPSDMWVFDRRSRGELIFLAGGRVRKLPLRSGMSQRDFAFALGRIQGWWEAISLQPVTFNAAGDWTMPVAGRVVTVEAQGAGVSA